MRLPWNRLHKFYDDPRSLLTGDAGASPHAECVIVDRIRALIRSVICVVATPRRSIEAGGW